MAAPIITIEVIADITCPWCYLGARRLAKAIPLADNVEVKLEWKPFMLDPSLPESANPYQAYIRQRLGSQDAVDEAERNLIGLGENEGIEFDFEAIKMAPNTLDAHRVIYWAGQDKEGVQTALTTTLFSLYFEQGQNISNHDVLINAAADTGMRADVVEKLLVTDIDRDTIKKDTTHASAIGITGVPSFIINRKYVVMGAQSADVLADMIGQIAAGFEPGSAEDR